MADLNDGKPFYVPAYVKGVPDLWPEAKEGDRIRINDGKTVKEYQLSHGDWYVRSTAWLARD